LGDILSLILQAFYEFALSSSKSLWQLLKRLFIVFVVLEAIAYFTCPSKISIATQILLILNLIIIIIWFFYPNR